MPNPEKIEIVRELHEEIEGSKAFLMTDYRGLKVSEVSVLRRKLREVGAEYKVVKNTLFERAAEEVGRTGMSSLLSGPTAIAFVKDDPIAPAKTLVDFMKDHKALEIKGGYVEGNIYDAAQITTLSKVPPRQQLIAQLLGSMQSPLAGLVGTLQGTISNLVYTLQAVVEKQAA